MKEKNKSWRTEYDMPAEDDYDDGNIPEIDYSHNINSYDENDADDDYYY